MAYFTYIMASRPGGALYTGSTSNLRQRVEQHRSGATGGHTAKYNIRTLVWFQAFPTYGEAMEQERRIKRWKRVRKDQLIMEANPNWRDVSGDIPFD